MEVDKTGDNNRLVLLLIAGIPVTVVLIATWLWYYVAQGKLDLVGIVGTSNSGSLLQPPRQLDGIDLREAGALPFQYSTLDRKWTFVVPGSSVCDASCEKTLYTTRQIHIAMGKEFHRIRRIYLSDTAPADTGFKLEHLSDKLPAPATFAEFVATEHRGMKALVLAPQQHREVFAEYLLAPGTWYLVDPAGWIMMSYNGEVDYKGVMSDLKFLLKNSSE